MVQCCRSAVTVLAACRGEGLMPRCQSNKSLSRRSSTPPFLLPQTCLIANSTGRYCMAQGSPSRSATILLTAVAVVALGVYGYQQAARGIRVRRQKAADAQQQARVDKLIMAAVRGNVQAIRSMEHGITKSDALLMLQTAVYYGHADVVHEVFGLQLVPEQAPEIASGLHQAASLGYDDVLLELMKHGGDPNGVSGYVAPLPLAAVCGYPDVVTVLLASRARKDVRAFGIGTRGIEGMSPVGLAG